MTPSTPHTGSNCDLVQPQPLLQTFSRDNATFLQNGDIVVITNVGENGRVTDGRARARSTNIPDRVRRDSTRRIDLYEPRDVLIGHRHPGEVQVRAAKREAEGEGDTGGRGEQAELENAGAGQVEALYQVTTEKGAAASRRHGHQSCGNGKKKVGAAPF